MDVNDEPTRMDLPNPLSTPAAVMEVQNTHPPVSGLSWSAHYRRIESIAERLSQQVEDWQTENGEVILSPEAEPTELDEEAFALQKTRAAPQNEPPSFTRHLCFNLRWALDHIAIDARDAINNGPDNLPQSMHKTQEYNAEDFPILYQEAFKCANRIATHTEYGAVSQLGKEVLKVLQGELEPLMQEKTLDMLYLNCSSVENNCRGFSHQ